MRTSTTKIGSQGRPILAYFMGALAVLTCPCHLPFLILLLSGTAAGAFLYDNFALALLVLLPIFLLTAITTWRLLDRSEEERR